MAKIEFEEVKGYLQNLADDIIKFGKFKYPGFEIECFLSYGYESEISIEGGLPKATDGFGGGVGIRVAEKKRSGFASSSGLMKEVLDSTVDDAVNTMRAIDNVDEKFQGFADPKKQHTSDGDIYKPLLDLTSAELIQMVNQITSEAREVDKRIATIVGQTGITYGGFAVANSRGINSASSALASFIVIQTIAMETGSDKRKIGFEFDISRSRSLEWDGLAEKSAKHAIELLDTMKLNKTEVLPTIWDPRIGSSYILSSLGSALNGRNVVEGRSRFSDRIGDKISLSEFSLYDDGQLPEALSTSSVDAEGLPRQRTSLVEGGVLKQFLFDTANADRGGQGYTSTPTIGASTFIVPEGSADLEKGISEISEGIYMQDFVQGLGHSDAISGDFSALAPQSFLVKDGEIAGSLDPVTIAGNFYKGLNNIRTICTDATLTPWSIKIPTLVLDGFTISG
ncbi:MAG: TldD/PmbA family protein [Candidatus Hodarchaeales archaeon]|jgi:PmbA protein